MLNRKLDKFGGSIFEPIYHSKKEAFTDRIKNDLRNRLCGCCGLSEQDVIDCESGDAIQQIPNIYPTQNKYSVDYILRDLFLWSVFMDMPDMAKVLLFHIQSRICAVLIAAAIFKRYAKYSTTDDMRNKFKSQSLEFETYAAMFVDQCYEFNKERTCELLLRQMPLFGNITCMQVIISFYIQ